MRTFWELMIRSPQASLQLAAWPTQLEKVGSFNEDIGVHGAGALGFG